MDIRAQDGKTVLARQRGNPGIVRRYRGGTLFQGVPDISIVRRRISSNLEYYPVLENFVEPGRPTKSVSSDLQAEAIFANHDYGQVWTRAIRDRFADRLVAFGKRRECIGIENHSRSSGPTVSNSSSI